MDVHERDTDVKDHTSIGISRKYDGSAHKALEIKTELYIGYNSFPPHATMIVQINVTVSSSGNKK